MTMGVPSQITAVVDARDDGELAQLAAGGDKQAATELIHRYQGLVRRFLRRLTGRDDLADDLAQDTFVRMLNYADRYDPKYPMRTWLLTIARRLSINSGRRQGRMFTTEEFHGVQRTEEAPDLLAERADENRAQRAQLNRAMAQLTDSQRQAILLFHQQGLPVQEVAEVMGLPVGTVKSHLHRGRAAMKKLLGMEIQEGNP